MEEESSELEHPNQNDEEEFSRMRKLYTSFRLAAHLVELKMIEGSVTLERKAMKFCLDSNPFVRKGSYILISSLIKSEFVIKIDQIIPSCLSESNPIAEGEVWGLLQVVQTHYKESLDKVLKNKNDFAKFSKLLTRELCSSSVVLNVNVQNVVFGLEASLINEITERLLWKVPNVAFRPFFIPFLEALFKATSANIIASKFLLKSLLNDHGDFEAIDLISLKHLLNYISGADLITAMKQLDEQALKYESAKHLSFTMRLLKLLKCLAFDGSFLLDSQFIESNFMRKSFRKSIEQADLIEILQFATDRIEVIQEIISFIQMDKSSIMSFVLSKNSDCLMKLLKCDIDAEVKRDIATTLFNRLFEGDLPVSPFVLDSLDLSSHRIPLLIDPVFFEYQKSYKSPSFIKSLFDLMENSNSKELMNYFVIKSIQLGSYENELQKMAVEYFMKQDLYPVLLKYAVNDLLLQSDNSFEQFLMIYNRYQMLMNDFLSSVEFHVHGKYKFIEPELICKSFYHQATSCYYGESIVIMDSCLENDIAKMKFILRIVKYALDSYLANLVMQHVNLILESLSFYCFAEDAAFISELSKVSIIQASILTHFKGDENFWSYLQSKCDDLNYGQLLFKLLFSSGLACIDQRQDYSFASFLYLKRNEKETFEQLIKSLGQPELIQSFSFKDTEGILKALESYEISGLSVIAARNLSKINENEQLDAFRIIIDSLLNFTSKSVFLSEQYENAIAEYFLHSKIVIEIIAFESKLFGILEKTSSNLLFISIFQLFINRVDDCLKGLNYRLNDFKNNQEQFDVNLYEQLDLMHLFSPKVISLVLNLHPTKSIVCWKYFLCLFERSLKEKSDFCLAFSTLIKNRKIELDIVLEFISDNIDSHSSGDFATISSLLDNSLLIKNVYFSLLTFFPFIVREWVNRKKNRKFHLLTEKVFSPILIANEMAKIDKSQYDDTFSIKTLRSSSANTILASYHIEDVSMEISFIIPRAFPLDPILIEGGKRVGVSEAQWRKWLLSIQTIMSSQASISEGISLWKMNADKKFQGVAECTICYSVFQPTDKTLPTQTCKTCKNKFHSSCLYKWFKSSSQATCPLCRSFF